jgi:hypothetical protein
MNMKLWNSCLLADAESRKVIIAFDDTPSASGILRGSDLLTCFSLQEVIRKHKRKNAKKVLFIGNGL